MTKFKVQLFCIKFYDIIKIRVYKIFTLSTSRCRTVQKIFKIKKILGQCYRAGHKDSRPEN